MSAPSAATTTLLAGPGSSTILGIAIARPRVSRSSLRLKDLLALRPVDGFTTAEADTVRRVLLDAFSKSLLWFWAIGDGAPDDAEKASIEAISNGVIDRDGWIEEEAPKLAIARAPHQPVGPTGKAPDILRRAREKSPTHVTYSAFYEDRVDLGASDKDCGIAKLAFERARRELNHDKIRGNRPVTPEEWDLAIRYAGGG